MPKVDIISYDDRMVITIDESKMQYLNYSECDVTFHFEKERSVSIERLLQFYIDNHIRHDAHK